MGNDIPVGIVPSHIINGGKTSLHRAYLSLLALDKSFVETLLLDYDKLTITTYHLAI